MPEVAPDFLPWLKQAIPLAGHMGIESLAWQQDHLVCQLELAPLVNDKGTGFGGGVAGLATLLGWCFVTLLLDEQGGRCPVVVKASSNAFLAPITSDFEMRCWCDEAGWKSRFLGAYQQKGRARLTLQVQVLQQGQPAFTYQGEYVALGNAP